MSGDFEIKNKVADSGLVNFDLAALVPKGERLGIDLKEFLWEGLILKEKDFREKVASINPEDFCEKLVHIYNSADAIVPLWAYFLIAAKLAGIAHKVVYGTQKDLEVLLLHDTIKTYDFSIFEGKRVLVKGCSEGDIPENAYIELVMQLQPLVKSLMFGEACSSVPILKN